MLPPGACNFIANRIDDGAAHQRVLANLREVIAGLSDQERRVTWALELEPGPIFALRDWATLHALCTAIEADEMLSPYVGVNLDIAHWRMARGKTVSGRITPELVRSSDAVLGRMAHAHIAGHHDCTHLGDLTLDVLNDPLRDFGPWLDLLQDLPSLGNRLFSGHVSVELEAAKCNRMTNAVHYAHLLSCCDCELRRSRALQHGSRRVIGWSAPRRHLRTWTAPSYFISKWSG